MRDFRELKVWEKAHGVALDVYKVTQGFPKDELYGLTSQMRRSAASVGANIAEGCGKLSKPDFGDSCRQLWDRRASWSTTCCWRGTWVIWKMRIT